MPRKPLKGVFPLMPFVVDANQEMDLEGLKNNIRSYEDAGFDGYIAFGCMGEFYAPSDEEFKKFVDIAVDATKRLPAYSVQRFIIRLNASDAQSTFRTLAATV